MTTIDSAGLENMIMELAGESILTSEDLGRVHCGLGIGDFVMEDRSFIGEGRVNDVAAVLTMNPDVGSEYRFRSLRAAIMGKKRFLEDFKGERGFDEEMAQADKLLARLDGLRTPVSVS